MSELINHLQRIPGLWLFVAAVFVFAAQLDFRAVRRERRLALQGSKRRSRVLSSSDL